MPKACSVGFVKRFELILRALVPDELMTGKQHGFVFFFQQQARRFAAEHVDDHRPRHGRDGAGAPVQTIQLHHAIARRAAIVNNDVGEVDQLLAGGMGRLGLLAMGPGNNGDDRKPSLCAPRAISTGTGLIPLVEITMNASCGPKWKPFRICSE